MLKTKTSVFFSILLALAAACGSGSSNQVDTNSAVSNAEASTEAALPKAEEILDGSIEAAGGKAAYESVKSFKVVGDFAIPAQKIQGAMRLIGAEGGKLVLEVEIPGIGTERSGSDGTTVWSMSNMTGSRVLEGPERERMLRDADLLKELHWRDYYKSATTTGVEDVEGKAAYMVEMVDNADVKETRFYDKESGLLVRQTGIVKSQMGEIKNDMHLRDYKEFGGMLLPSVVEVEAMGMKQVMTTTAVEVNPTLDDTTFALPDEIQKLVGAAN